jgi:hypothetical protein
MTAFTVKFKNCRYTEFHHFLQDPKMQAFNPTAAPVLGDTDDILHNDRLDDPCMHCGFEPMLEDCQERSHDFTRSTRRVNLLKAIDLRRGSENRIETERFSSGFIAEQAAHRYFMLLDSALAELKAKFTEQEFSVMLNTQCTPIWQWQTRYRVSCDHVPIRSWPLFKARDVMRGVIESFKAEKAT